MKLLFINLFIFLTLSVSGQAKLVINGAVISISNGAALVIDNPDNTAIIQTGAGYISSEAALNKIVWSIGAGNAGTYLIPFGNASGYIPLQFSAASGSANGQVLFSTYATPGWKNSDDLPPGVTNVDGNGTDNSAKVIDRFWQINPQGYTIKPTLSNLSFTYFDAEYNTPNTITEANLVTQRWNTISNTWADYSPFSVISTTTNRVTVPAIPGNELYDWWTLVDANFNLPITLLDLKVREENKTAVISWKTVSESNSSHFEVWRSKDPGRFDSVGRVAAAGNSSNLLTYSFTDIHPYPGISYYRLKSVDGDGKFKWSPIVKLVIADEARVSLYPNPADGYINIAVSASIADKKPIAYLYDAKGSVLRSFTISKTLQLANIAALPAGVYHIYFIYNDNPQTLSFIKK
jgi:hypothetical protein